MKKRTLALGKSKSGESLALVRNTDGSYNCMVRCANYCGHAKGGVSHTWRGFAINVSADEALVKFNNRSVTTQVERPAKAA